MNESQAIGDLYKLISQEIVIIVVKVGTRDIPAKIFNKVSKAVLLVLQYLVG